MVVCLSTGCRYRESLINPRPDEWAREVAGAPQSLDDLLFWKVDESLYRGGQPTPTQFVGLQQLGIKTVVNVRRTREDRELVEALGMNYVMIPIPAWDMDEEHVLEFLQVMKDPANHPVYLMCHFGGDRSAALHGIYRVVYQGWAPEEAACEMVHGGYHFHPIWQNLIQDVCEVDAAMYRRKLGIPTPPPPPPEVGAYHPRIHDDGEVCDVCGD